MDLLNPLGLRGSNPVARNDRSSAQHENGKLMRAAGALVLAVWSVCLFGQPALADKRVALVIGNSGYQNVARLGNPTNDASAITEILKGAGFDLVESRRDLKISEMRRVFRDFANSSRDADVAVVYYAGHGIEVEGTNYLIPIDASLEQDLDVYDEAFSLDRILVTIEPAKQLRLVILDACRNNPFAKAMKRTIGSRAIGMGLAKVEPSSPNTLIAFASKAGSTASDGDSKNSPFTAALVRHIAKPGLDLRKAFGFVRDDVLKNTSNKQEPYVYGSLGGDDVPLVPAKPVVAEPPHNAQADIRRDYELALQVGTKKVWDAFIASYPSGFYTELAEAQRGRSIAEETRIAATDLPSRKRRVLLWRVQGRRNRPRPQPRQQPPRRPGSPPRRLRRSSRQRFSPRKSCALRRRKLRIAKRRSLLNNSRLSHHRIRQRRSPPCLKPK